jgi:hypothetical protein
MTYVATAEEVAEPSAIDAATSTQAPAPQGNQPLLRGIGFGLVLLAVVGALAYPALARRRGR